MPAIFLLHHGGLHGAKLRIGDIARRKLTQRHHPVERFVPARNAVSPNNSGRIGRIVRHSLLLLAGSRANNRQVVRIVQRPADTNKDTVSGFFMQNSIPWNVCGDETDATAWPPPGAG